VPVTVKENIASKGVPMPLGYRRDEARACRAGCAGAARLREAGAVMFCKTTMPDYGMTSSAYRASTR